MKALVAAITVVAVLIVCFIVSAEPKHIHEDTTPNSLGVAEEDVLVGNHDNGTEPKPISEDTTPNSLEVAEENVLVGNHGNGSEPKPIHEEITSNDLEVVAEDVLVGNYGNGVERVERLTDLGLTSDQVEAVQDIVDTMVPAVVVPTTQGASESKPNTTVSTNSGGVWQGSRPAYYGGNSGCSQHMADIIARAMWAQGANNDEVSYMLAIVSRESGCNSSAFNGNSATGDQSYGLCQINALAGFFKSGQILSGYSPGAFAENPKHNAEACAALWARCGFHPWQKGNYGCHRP